MACLKSTWKESKVELVAFDKFQNDCLPTEEAGSVYIMFTLVIGYMTGCKALRTGEQNSCVAITHLNTNLIMPEMVLQLLKHTTRCVIECRETGGNAIRICMV